MDVDRDPIYEDDAELEIEAISAEDDEAMDLVSSLPGDPVARLTGLVDYLARNLVDAPDAVDVTAEKRGNSVFITLHVPEVELGKVIGRQGRIARAVRTALTIAGSRHHLRASLDIEG